MSEAKMSRTLIFLCLLNRHYFTEATMVWSTTCRLLLDLTVERRSYQNPAFDLNNLPITSKKQGRNDHWMKGALLQISLLYAYKFCPFWINFYILLKGSLWKTGRSKRTCKHIALRWKEKWYNKTCHLHCNFLYVRKMNQPVHTYSHNANSLYCLRYCWVCIKPNWKYKNIPFIYLSLETLCAKA